MNAYYSRSPPRLANHLIIYPSEESQLHIMPQTIIVVCFFFRFAKLDELSAASISDGLSTMR